MASSTSEKLGASSVHPVVTNDPIQLKGYVGKVVIIETRDGQSHRGWVYTVDPVDGSYILMTKKEDKVSVHCIMGHALKSVAVLENETDGMTEEGASSFLKLTTKPVTSEQCKLRKEKVKAWLEKRLLPVTEDGDVLRIRNALEIQPPYDASSCYTMNSNVLEKIREVLQQMPD